MSDGLEAVLSASYRDDDNVRYNDMHYALQKLVKAEYKSDHATALFREIETRINADNSPRDVFYIMRLGAMLVEMGKIKHIKTIKARQYLLENTLVSSNQYLRSMATLGLAYLGEPTAADALKRAQNIEVHIVVKKQMSAVYHDLQLRHYNPDAPRPDSWGD